MKRRVYIAVSIALVITLGATIGGVSANVGRKSVEPLPAYVAVAPKPKPPTPDKLLELVNAERAKVGVKPLIVNDALVRSAQRKADDMVKYNYFDHVSPNDGRQGYSYVYDETSMCTYASENYYYDKTRATLRGALAGWRNSPPHIAAIRDSKYTYTGFGISDNRVVVQHFCQTN